MKWSDSEFMEMIQNLLLNYFQNEKESGNEKYDERIEEFEKLGYKAENFIENIIKNSIYAMGHYFGLIAGGLGDMLNWTWNKLYNEINKFLDKKVMWIVRNPDACPWCKNLDGKVFKMRNLPITHPNCRCGIVKVDDNIFESDMSRTKKDLYGRPGTSRWFKEKEIFYGEDGRATKVIDRTDHGNPKEHSNPHEHMISWDGNGNPDFSRQINNYKE
ncbi:MAG: phage head morphogenesis protein [Oscillospiraceae bacterium]|nr:phage head morphogenesis protein [Oscillospiraceae bacterium]